MLTLLVLADPKAPFLTALGTLPNDVRVVISDDTRDVPAYAAIADAILYAYHDGDLLVKAVQAAPHLKWVHSLWTGVEGILKPAVVEHSLMMTNGKGVFRWPLADWVVASMLFFAFELRRIVKQQEQGVWKIVHGTMLEGKTLGIVGYGAIGSAAAERAKCFGMKIAALRRRTAMFEGDSLVDRSYAPGELKELLAASDYVLAAAPLTEETKGMIGEAEIAGMKPGAVIMNVGRGAVIDERALIAALQAGKIRGAALDVFETEPLPAGHPFWKMENVLLSPHTADRVNGFMQPAFECFFENLGRFRKGEALGSVVDKHAGY